MLLFRRLQIEIERVRYAQMQMQNLRKSIYAIYEDDWQRKLAERRRMQSNVTVVYCFTVVLQQTAVRPKTQNINTRSS